MTLKKKLISFLRAVFSKSVNLETYLNRLNTCKDCSWRIEKNNRNYCKECGCPETSFWYFSELKTKCKYSKLECPRKKW